MLGQLAVSVILQGSRLLTGPLDLDVDRAAVFMSNQIGAPIQSRLKELIDQPPLPAQFPDNLRLNLRLRFS